VEDYFAGLLQLAEASTSPLAQDRKAEKSRELLKRIYRNRFWRKAFLSAICRNIEMPANHFGSLCKMFIYQEKNTLLR
jgi:hypothetical protein